MHEAPWQTGHGRRDEPLMERVTALSFATALSAAGTVEEVDEVIRTRLARVVGASGAILGMVDRDTGELRLRLSDLIPDEIAARYERVALHAAGPFREVMETRDLLVLHDHDDWRRHSSPEVAADAMASNLATTIFVALLDSGGDPVAALAVAWSEVVEVSDATIATLRTVADLCEQTLERANATDQATAHATHLARLAELLADAMTVNEALETVTLMGPEPVGATATSVGLVDEAAGVLRTHHGRAVAEAVRRRYQDPQLDARLAFTDAARLGEAVLIGTYEAYIERYPDGADTVAELGFGARAAVPVRRADGQIIGSIVHAWAGPRSFDEALVSTLTTIADMAGQAIERAGLVEQIQLDSARHEALASLAELLASSRTGLQVAEMVALHSARVVGAQSANLALVDDASSSLEVHHNPNLAREVRERYTTLPLDAAIPHADALREGTMLVFEDLDEFAVRYPHLVDDLKAAGRQACAVVPLVGSGGAPLGAIGFAWNDPTTIAPSERAIIRDVADLCSQALERARLSDAEHRLVTTLQESVLRPLVEMPGLDVAARYLPAARHIGMGGDWYQGIALDHRRYAVIVGDVAGHGITAIGDMAQLKAVIGALVTVGTPLGDVFAETTRLLRSGDRSVTATALIAVIDLEADEMTYAVAGHPPPLLRAPDGRVTQLVEGRQPLLGVSTDAICDVARCPFPVGSTFVAYTDGLVERRRESMDRSVDRLAQDLQGITVTDAEHIASEILAANLAPSEPDDDVALVVVSRAR